MNAPMARKAWLEYLQKAVDEFDWEQEPDFGSQPNMQFGMNQDDWKDIVAAISKARDSRGIYLGCRPADVFQDWFLALGTFKPKEKV
jgi:hypothetical protein